MSKIKVGDLVYGIHGDASYKAELISIKGSEVIVLPDGKNGRSSPIVTDISKLTKTERTFNMDSFKAYLENHRDVFFTIGIVLVLDHFIFSGVFREKLKNIIDSLLDKKTKAIVNGK